MLLLPESLTGKAQPVYLPSALDPVIFCSFGSGALRHTLPVFPKTWRACLLGNASVYRSALILVCIAALSIGYHRRKQTITKLKNDQHLVFQRLERAKSGVQPYLNSKARASVYRAIRVLQGMASNNNFCSTCARALFDSVQLRIGAGICVPWI